MQGSQTSPLHRQPTPFPSATARSAVSVGPEPNDLLEQARRQINRLAEEIARLSEMELAPADYYGEFLQRVLTALAAPAGAVWLRTPQGNLQLQYQINMREVLFDDQQG